MRDFSVCVFVSLAVNSSYTMRSGAQVYLRLIIIAPN